MINYQHPLSSPCKKISKIALSLLVVLFSLCFILSSVTEGAYLRNVPQALKQPNGEALNCFASGDEHYNWLHDKDGFTIIRDPNTGYYVYAEKKDEEIVASMYIVGEINPRDIGLQPRINISADKIRKKIAFKNQAKLNSPHKNSLQGIGQAAPAGAYISRLNNLVIFIRFKDQEEFPAQASAYYNMFNSNISGANSMRNYFLEASYNQINVFSYMYRNPFGEYIIAHQDSHPRAYYEPYNAVTNPDGYKDFENYVIREQSLLKDAIEYIREEVPIYINLDRNNDGCVDNICFVVKGEPDGWSDLLWPHMWEMFLYDLEINEKKVRNYNFQLESVLDTGVLCHEMCHSLGFPDLYHYSFDEIDPVFTWDLMEYDLNPPQHMGAYMKYRYGNWISSIPEITTSGTYTLNPLISATNNCYKIASPNSTTEYFVVEYRRQQGTFESSLWGEGLLVYRINTTQYGNSEGPPDEVYIYRPNGTATEDGAPWYANFNSSVGRTTINDSTNPSSFLSDGSPGGLNISEIGAVGDTISFTITVAGGGGDIDITPPSITITTPTTGSTAMGLITIAASATDNVAIAGVQFYLDGDAIGSEITSSPYSTSYNVATLSNENHTITAVARDTSSNTATTSVVITVNNTVEQTATAGGNWVINSYTSQNKTFTVEFDAIPSTTTLNGFIGLGQGNKFLNYYTGYACLVLFNSSGKIQARKASRYCADVSLPYYAGLAYHFRLVVNVTARKYSIYVTPPGGGEVTLGYNYRFRTEHLHASYLSKWGIKVGGSSGSLSVSNFAITATNTVVHTSSAISTKWASPLKKTTTTNNSSLWQKKTTTPPAAANPKKTISSVWKKK